MYLILFHTTFKSKVPYFSRCLLMTIHTAQCTVINSLQLYNSKALYLTMCIPGMHTFYSVCLLSVRFSDNSQTNLYQAKHFP